MAKQRTRRAGNPCPQCGAEMHVVEVGIEPAEWNEPMEWQPVSRQCSRGCLLIAADFPEGE